MDKQITEVEGKTDITKLMGERLAESIAKATEPPEYLQKGSSDPAVQDEIKAIRALAKKDYAAAENLLKQYFDVDNGDRSKVIGLSVRDRDIKMEAAVGYGASLLAQGKTAAGERYFYKQLQLDIDSNSAYKQSLVSADIATLLTITQSEGKITAAQAQEALEETEKSGQAYATNRQDEAAEILKKPIALIDSVENSQKTLGGAEAKTDAKPKADNSQEEDVDLDKLLSEHKYEMVEKLLQESLDQEAKSGRLPNPREYSELAIVQELQNKYEDCLPNYKKAADVYGAWMKDGFDGINHHGQLDNTISQARVEAKLGHTREAGAFVKEALSYCMDKSDRKDVAKFSQKSYIINLDEDSK